MKKLALYLTAAFLAGSGCAPRSVPNGFPDASPASASAAEATRAPLTCALDEDPPLPGAPSEGWSGLDAASTAPAGESHHHAGHRPASASPPAQHVDHESPEAAHPPDMTKPPHEEQATTYVCPMHPEVTSDRPGRCSKCGMNLEPKR